MIVYTPLDQPVVPTAGSKLAVLAVGGVVVELVAVPGRASEPMPVNGSGDTVKVTGCPFWHDATGLASVAVGLNVEPIATWSGPT
jgi:hypothetical protein